MDDMCGLCGSLPEGAPAAAPVQLLISWRKSHVFRQVFYRAIYSTVDLCARVGGSPPVFLQGHLFNC